MGTCEHFSTGLKKRFTASFSSRSTTVLASAPTTEEFQAEMARGLSFADRCIYYKEFGHAYGSTFTGNGELRGQATLPTLARQRFFGSQMNH
jgi:hypothetical protein